MEPLLRYIPKNYRPARECLLKMTPFPGISTTKDTQKNGTSRKSCFGKNLPEVAFLLIVYYLILEPVLFEMHALIPHGLGLRLN